MRKCILISLIIGLLITSAAVAMAADKTQVDVYDQQKDLVKSIVFLIDKDEYFVNGQTPGVKIDAKPFIEQGRTFVPVRYLGNALGVDNDHIIWESPRAIFKQPAMPVVELAVGSKVIKSEGAARTMDTVPLLKTGRTYLPARWVAEALGYEVAWDAENSVVLCWPKGAEKPDVSSVISYVKGQPVEQPPGEEQPVGTPTTPVGSMKELFDKAKPVEGTPFSFAGWQFDPGIQKGLQEGWDLSNDVHPVIQEVIVNDLSPNGIKMGDIIIHDLNVSKDGITITATNPGRYTPFFYLVEEGNVIRYKGGGGYMGKETGTLKIPVDHIRAGTADGMSFLPAADITKVTHILFEFGGELLKVKNPIYQGGN